MDLRSYQSQEPTMWIMFWMSNVSWWGKWSLYIYHIYFCYLVQQHCSDFRSAREVMMSKFWTDTVLKVSIASWVHMKAYGSASDFLYLCMSYICQSCACVFMHWEQKYFNFCYVKNIAVLKSTNLISLLPRWCFQAYEVYQNWKQTKWVDFFLNQLYITQHCFPVKVKIWIYI